MKKALQGSFVILLILYSFLKIGNAEENPYVILTVTDPGQPAGISIAAGTAGTLVGRLSLAIDTGSVLITALRVSNAGSAVHGDDIFALTLYADSDGNGFIDAGVDNFLGHSYWSETESSYVFSDIDQQVIFGTPLKFLIAMHTAAGATVGNYFIMSANDSGIILDGSDIVSPFSVTGSNFNFTESTASGSANSAAPMVIIVNPKNSGAVSGDFLVRLHVHNPNGLSNLMALELSTDSGNTYPYSFNLINDLNLNYNVGANAAIFETVLTLSPGGYSLIARATNTLLTSTSPVSPVLVNPPGIGDGNLLRRDNSDQLCADCHALKNHSSQSVGNKYGAWGFSCRDCHTPHDTKNIFLIKEEIIAPNFGSYNGKANIFFSKSSGITASSLISDATYANPDNSGPCQVCHTRTSGPGGPRFRSTGNSDSHYSDPYFPVRCTLCHLHSNGFKAVPIDICDGIDNDNDGLTDEDYTPRSTTCGVGECATSGQTTCVGGVEGDTCTPGTPTAEVCDNLDNNCDSYIDEGYTDTDGDGMADCVDSDDDNDCIGDFSDNCPLTMPALITGTPTAYYPTIWDAYSNATNNDTIQCQDIIYVGDFTAGRNITVSIQGGYDCSYSTVPGVTSIEGNIIINNGKVTIENMDVQ
jgi:hypothetical protein